MVFPSVEGLKKLANIRGYDIIDEVSINILIDKITTADCVEELKINIYILLRFFTLNSDQENKLKLARLSVYEDNILLSEMHEISKEFDLLVMNF